MHDPQELQYVVDGFKLKFASQTTAQALQDWVKGPSTRLGEFDSKGLCKLNLFRGSQ